MNDITHLTQNFGVGGRREKSDFWATFFWSKTSKFWVTFFWSKISNFWVTFEAYDFVFPADEWLANRTCRDFIMFSIGGNWVTFQHVVWFLKFYHVLGGLGGEAPSEKFSVFLGVFIDFTFFFRVVWGAKPQKNFQVVFQTDWFFLSVFSPGGSATFKMRDFFSAGVKFSKKSEGRHSFIIPKA